MLHSTYNVEISAAVSAVRDARGTAAHPAALATLAGLIRAAIAAETDERERDERAELARCCWPGGGRGARSL